MAVLGIGCDLVDLRRVQAIFDDGKGVEFIKRLTGREQSLDAQQAALEWAAREAARKASATLDASYRLSVFAIDWEGKKVSFPGLSYQAHLSWVVRGHHAVALVIVEK